MKKNIVIIGAGSLGREIYGWVTDVIVDGAQWAIKGFLDARPDALDRFQIPTPILGSIEEYQAEPEDLFVAALGNPKEKKKAVTIVQSNGGKFVNVIHPQARIGRDVELGVGIVLAPFAVLDCDLKVDNFVTVLYFSTFGHDTRIGDWCQISSHCALNGRAVLGEGVFLGSHACIIPQTKVGDWAYVGAGSVVIQDVEPETKVFGNPARPLTFPGRHDRAFEP